MVLLAQPLLCPGVKERGGEEVDPAGENVGYVHRIYVHVFLPLFVYPSKE